MRLLTRETARPKTQDVEGVAPAGCYRRRRPKSFVPSRTPPTAKADGMPRPSSGAGAPTWPHPTAAEQGSGVAIAAAC
jgi:hypothetical protein